MSTRSRSRSDAGQSAKSLLEAVLPSDSEALRAFAMALPAELYARTAHLEKLKAQLVVLKGARYGHSPEKLGGEIEQGEAEIAPAGHTRYHPESRGVISALQRGIHAAPHKSLTTLGMTPSVRPQ
jgi:transposase